MINYLRIISLHVIYNCKDTLKTWKTKKIDIIKVKLIEMLNFVVENKHKKNEYSSVLQFASGFGR